MQVRTHTGSVFAAISSDGTIDVYFSPQEPDDVRRPMYQGQMDGHLTDFPQAERRTGCSLEEIFEAIGNTTSGSPVLPKKLQPSGHNEKEQFDSACGLVLSSMEGCDSRAPKDAKLKQAVLEAKVEKGKNLQRLYTALSKAA